MDSSAAHCFPLPRIPWDLRNPSCIIWPSEATIPSMKHLHPIMSWCLAYVWRDGCNPRTILYMLAPPRERAYSEMQSARSGSVCDSRSQASSRWQDELQLPTRPTSLQKRMCAHVSSSAKQLGHFGDRFGVNLALWRLVAATLHICLLAHTWNIRGTRCRAW